MYCLLCGARAFRAKEAREFAKRRAGVQLACHCVLPSPSSLEWADYQAFGPKHNQVFSAMQTLQGAIVSGWHQLVPPGGLLRKT